MKDLKNSPIGIFDSGVGGLTVFKEIKKALPKEDIVYFGDTLRAPYGAKNKEELFKYACQIINFLKTKNVKLIIIACNTVSTNCYNELKNVFPQIPIFEIIGTGVLSALKKVDAKKIGVIATESTVKTKQYEIKIKNAFKGVEVYERACPFLVPLIERGLLKSPLTFDMVKYYLKDFKNIDTLILGCTHYPFLQNMIEDILGKDIKIINPADEIAYNIKSFILENNINNGKGGKYNLFVSKKNPSFDKICENLLKKIYISEKINIKYY